MKFYCQYVKEHFADNPARCFVMNYEFIITLMALLIIFIQHIEFSTFAKFVNR